MTVVLVVCSVMLGVAALMLVARITRGPTTLDRVIAVDVLIAASICILGLEAAVNQHTTTLPILIVLALLGFIGSASVASFSRGSETIEEEEQ
jgi:multicomponent Na+:H+ antiporter subunit F